MSVDELLPRARELARDGLPSKNRLQKTLKVSWPKAVEVFQALSAEVDQSQRDRLKVRRQALIDMRRRKKSGRGLRLRSYPLPRSLASTPKPAADLTVNTADATLPEEVPAVPEGVLPAASRRVVTWPILLLTLPAFVAIWSGWVDLGRLTGFGVVHPFPGIWDQARLNTAITLPVGLETYAAYALYVWLSGQVPPVARRFAKWSAIGSLALGAAGQVAYHLMVAAGMTRAPWQITTIVACLPVAVLGLGAALRHLAHRPATEQES